MSRRKGQNVGEYVILIAIVIAVAAAMQIYVRRGLQGRVADAVDYSPTVNGWAFKTKQYEPYYLNQDSTVTSESDFIDTINHEGELLRNDNQQRITSGHGAWSSAENAEVFDKGRYY